VKQLRELYAKRSLLSEQFNNVRLEWTNNKTVDPACHVRKNVYASLRH
jgi:hypothetical protein